jgi:hypothetical protein
MVLQVRTCGRVGRRRTFSFIEATFGWPLCFFQHNLGSPGKLGETPDLENFREEPAMVDNGRGRDPRGGGGRSSRSGGSPTGGNRSSSGGTGSGSGGGRGGGRGGAAGRGDAGRGDAGRDDRRGSRRDSDPRDRNERPGRPAPTEPRGRTGRTGRTEPRGGTERGDRRARDPESRSVDQAKYDGPPIPEEITGQELDHNVLQQLAGLPEKLANRVARHLVAAGQLLEDEPEIAYQHTLAARARAARVAIVREATGEAAYAAGHYAEALSELRAAKRMNGANLYLAVMADCERALGRPEKALTLAKSPSLAKLPIDQQIEMTLVEAGARYDLGEIDGALRTLENAPLRSVTREDWLVRLRYAYADMLLNAGRHDEAIEWFHRTAGIDGTGTTDAAERILELEATPNQNTHTHTNTDR